MKTRAAELAEETHDPRAEGFALDNEMLFATLDGVFDAVETAAERWRALGNETGSAIAATLQIAHSCSPARYYSGHVEEAVAAYDDLAERWGVRRPVDVPRRWLYAVQAEPSAENIAALQRLLDEHLPSVRDGHAPEMLIMSLLEAAVEQSRLSAVTSALRGCLLDQRQES